MSAVTREQVFAAVVDRVANENLRRHMLATEAIMRGLAERLGEDPEVWGLTGLAHDLDKVPDGKLQRRHDDTDLDR